MVTTVGGNEVLRGRVGTNLFGVGPNADPAPKRNGNAKLVDKLLARHEQLKARKNAWNPHYQLLGEFVNTRKQEFTANYSEGEFLNRDLFDSTGPKASKISGSSIVSMVWPHSTRRLSLTHTSKLDGKPRAKKYFEEATRRVLKAMDAPEAGFATAINEYMHDQIVFGTSGIEGFRDSNGRIAYRAWSVKNISIAEGKGGFVDALDIEICFKLDRYVKEYGIQNVSKDARDKYNANKIDDEVTVVVMIRPNEEPQGQGNLAMTYRSTHIEKGAKHIVKESGFEEIPVKVGRFWKLADEIYGRSPAMEALPDIIELNAIWESVTIAIEKNLDPPLGVLQGSLGDKYLDTSPGGLNVFKLSGRAGESQQPIFPLFTVGQINDVIKLIEQLEKSIQEHFFVDRLLDFNNDTRMTLGEAQLRDRLRNASLGSVFSRQIAEVISPLVRWTFNEMLASGELGVPEGSVEERVEKEFGDPDVLIIPKEVVDLMADGEDVYEIKYFTPAERIMQAEEAETILRTWNAALEIANTGATGVIDNLDEDESIRRFARVIGAPSEILRAKDKVEEIREDRLEMQKAQMEMQAIAMGAEALRNAGQSGMVRGAESGNEGGSKAAA